MVSMKVSKIRRKRPRKRQNECTVANYTIVRRARRVDNAVRDARPVSGLMDRRQTDVNRVSFPS
jgi:hypothetical protein